MKTFITALLAGLLLVCAPSLFAAPDACMSGSFYDPDAPGEGIVVEVLETQTVIYYYRAEGSWFVLQGDDVAFSAYQPWNGGVVDVGDGYFSVVDNDNVLFGYDLLLDVERATPAFPIPWCLRSECEGDRAFVRLTQPIPCDPD